MTAIKDAWMAFSVRAPLKLSKALAWLQRRLPQGWVRTWLSDCQGRINRWGIKRTVRNLQELLKEADNA